MYKTATSRGRSAASTGEERDLLCCKRRDQSWPIKIYNSRARLQPKFESRTHPVPWCVANLNLQVLGEGNRWSPLRVSPTERVASESVKGSLVLQCRWQSRCVLNSQPRTEPDRGRRLLGWPSEIHLVEISFSPASVTARHLQNLHCKVGQTTLLLYNFVKQSHCYTKNNLRKNYSYFNKITVLQTIL